MNSNGKYDIKEETILRRISNQSFSEIDDEIVMLSINKGEYYSFNSVASDIWRLMEKNISFQELINEILTLYEIDKGTCILETSEYLNSLIVKKLALIIND